MNYLISATERGVVRFPDEAVLEAKAKERWNGAVIYAGTRPSGRYTIDVKRPGEPEFSIRLDPDGDALSTDGTEAQVAEVAVWARGLLPDHLDGELWLYDQAFYGHRVLDRSIREEDVWEDWQKNQ